MLSTLKLPQFAIILIICNLVVPFSLSKPVGPAETKGDVGQQQEMEIEVNETEDEEHPEYEIPENTISKRKKKPTNGNKPIVPCMDLPGCNPPQNPAIPVVNVPGGSLPQEERPRKHGHPKEISENIWWQSFPRKATTNRGW